MTATLKKRKKLCLKKWINNILTNPKFSYKTICKSFSNNKIFIGGYTWMKQIQPDDSNIRSLYYSKDKDDREEAEEMLISREEETAANTDIELLDDGGEPNTLWLLCLYFCGDTTFKYYQVLNNKIHKNLSELKDLKYFSSEKRGRFMYDLICKRSSIVNELNLHMDAGVYYPVSGNKDYYTKAEITLIDFYSQKNQLPPMPIFKRIFRIYEQEDSTVTNQQCKYLWKQILKIRTLTLKILLLEVLDNISINQILNI